MCKSCEQETKCEEDKQATKSPCPATLKESLNAAGTSGCNCSACVAKRSVFLCFH